MATEMTPQAGRELDARVAPIDLPADRKLRFSTRRPIGHFGAHGHATMR